MHNRTSEKYLKSKTDVFASNVDVDAEHKEMEKDGNYMTSLVDNSAGSYYKSTRLWIENMNYGRNIYHKIDLSNGLGLDYLDIVLISDGLHYHLVFNWHLLDLV